MQAADTLTTQRNDMIDMVTFRAVVVYGFDRCGIGYVVAVVLCHPP